MYIVIIAFQHSNIRKSGIFTIILLPALRKFHYSVLIAAYHVNDYSCYYDVKENKGRLLNYLKFPYMYLIE